MVLFFGVVAVEADPGWPLFLADMDLAFGPVFLRGSMEALVKLVGLLLVVLTTSWLSVILVVSIFGESEEVTCAPLLLVPTAKFLPIRSSSALCFVAVFSAFALLAEPDCECAAFAVPEPLPLLSPA